MANSDTNPRSVTEQAGDPPIDSVHRALVLLKALRDDRTLGVKDAAEMLGVAPSTAHRLLNALCYDGFAVQGRERRYRLGPEFRPDETRPLSISDLRAAVRPAIEDLSAQIGETVHVWIRQGPLLYWVDGVEGTAPAHVKPSGWDRVPAYASAAGKALLSELTNKQLEDVFAAGLPPARSSRIHDLRSLKRHLTAVRSRGYAISIEESAQGVDGVAVCAKDSLGRPVFAISLAIPSSRFDRAALPTYVDSLRVAVERTEEALGRSAGR
ncbi:IclR family transcriptional regulator [Gordonia aurantiaca]|uniref:IclR family transcriptional regulator n=1 Tax=Gordonia sp. B21 TaxID=3151852 RepID=UPI003265F78F